jgi:dihydroorotase
MAKLLIRNGRVIDPANGIDRVTDVLLAGGIVRGVGDNLPSRGAEEFDATGLVVAPGFIDMHVHLREPGFESSETIETGTRCAAVGGFTSVACMPNTNPVNDTPHLTRFIIERAKAVTKVNVFPIGAITIGSAGEKLASIGAMKAAGTVAISDDGKPVMNSRVMRRAMEIAASFDIPVIDHCEDLNLSAGGDMHEGKTSVRYGLRGIPGCSEDVMVARDLLLAEVTGARYHVAHISTRNAVAMVAEAKRRGLRVTCEVTPHHFAIHDEEIIPYDSNYKMKPPIRCNHDVEAMIEGLRTGVIDAIATDHAPHSVTDKIQEFERCPFGILGLETAIPISLERLVAPGYITLNRMIELFTTGPAGILSLNRGTLSPGVPGDVTILDPGSRWTYDVNKSPSKSRNSPFDGVTFTGRAVATIVEGEIIWQA